MTIPRLVDLKKLLKQKSFFLFGPRATGKTTLVRQQLGRSAQIIDLLNTQIYLKLSAAPYELENMIIDGAKSIIVIDEVQKAPRLLDEVHRLIEDKGICFLLTGSSARKLKRGQANMLAGRAWSAELFPFTWKELNNFKLNHFLRYGGLPTVYLSKNPQEELNAYVGNYLKEEIQSEGLVRKLDAFSRFLLTAALANGEMLNFAEVASDCAVAANTVREYFSILEDTLIGFFVPAWKFSKKRKAIKTAKFYFFDLGAVHTLLGTETLNRNSNIYGKSFEQFIALELRAYISYCRKNVELTYWRSKHGYEVDFLLGEKAAIEVKSTQRTHSKHLKGLRALKEEGIFSRFYLVSQDKIRSKQNGIDLMYWEDFLEQLWNHAII